MSARVYVQFYKLFRNHERFSAFKSVDAPRNFAIGFYFEETSRVRTWTAADDRCVISKILRTALVTVGEVIARPVGLRDELSFKPGGRTQSL